MTRNRKPIQITATANANHTVAVLYTLCDDGSIWYLFGKDVDPKWVQLPDMPEGRDRL